MQELPAEAFVPGLSGDSPCLLLSAFLPLTRLQTPEMKASSYKDGTVLRYDFFKDEPALLGAKMADYIMAALYQDGIQQSQVRPDCEGSRERSTGEATVNTA